ncbi:hypothetical protein JL722_6835 [Aureococcus anophagefferens]|nr:hypothetical protein JL722_6835 [Aureococcus anophagefferens]
MASYAGAGNDRFIPCRSGSRFELAREDFENDGPRRAPRRAAARRCSAELLGGARPPCALGFSPAKPRPASPGPGTAPRRGRAATAAAARAARRRRIQGAPFKVLDAPGLSDDFYLDLVHWSSSNVLAVGLGRRRATARVGTLCWRGDALASGSRDRAICCRDVREPRSNYALRAPPGGLRPALEPLRRLPRVRRQRQRLEGLGRAAPAAVVRGRRGAARRRGPGPGGAAARRRAAAARRRSAASATVAAVKAIAWSPHKRGSLASGAGTADRTIKFWDARTCALVDSVDTGSQVCALAWSRSVDELVSTHGYSLNQICIWNTIVTGAGDETLRFWSCFPGARGPGSRAPPHAPAVLR